MSLFNSLIGGVSGTNQQGGTNNPGQSIGNIVESINQSSPGMRLGIWITATVLSAVSIVGLPLLGITIPNIVQAGKDIKAAKNSVSPNPNNPQQTFMTPGSPFAAANDGNSAESTAKFLSAETVNTSKKNQVLLEAESNREVALMKSAMSNLGGGSATDLSKMDTTDAQPVVLLAASTGSMF